MDCLMHQIRFGKSTLTPFRTHALCVLINEEEFLQKEKAGLKVRFRADFWQSAAKLGRKWPNGMRHPMHAVGAPIAFRCRSPIRLWWHLAFPVGCSRGLSCYCGAGTRQLPPS